MAKANMQAAAAAAAAMGKKSDLWKPDPGVHFARVLEPIGAMGDNFFAGFPLHWGFGDPVPCPKRLFGGVCPLCVQGNRLPENEGKKFWPSWSAYMNILLVDEDGDPIPDAEGEAQVKVWRVGRETLGKIFNAIERESPSVDALVNITDSEEGIDLRVKRTGKDKDDTEWDVSCVRRGASSIEEYREAWEPKALDLTTYVTVKSADEMVQLLVGAQDAFSQAQAEAKPSVKRLPRRTSENTESDDTTHAAGATVITASGEEVDAPQQESSGKAKLQKLIDKGAKK